MEKPGQREKELNDTLDEILESLTNWPDKVQQRILVRSLLAGIELSDQRSAEEEVLQSKTE